jgi:ribosomal protein S18 acetylase RimI-like enzyme
MEDEIVIAREPEEIAQARRLIAEYAESLGCSPCLRSIEQELRGFPQPFASPGGALLLALHQGQGVGVVGIKQVEDRVAEMARLYVRPDYRGRSLGKQLAREAIALAGRMGYAAIRLYTLSSMTTALALYQKLGFREIAPYGEHPISTAHYLEKSLDRGLSGGALNNPGAADLAAR